MTNIGGGEKEVEEEGNQTQVNHLQRTVFLF